MQLQSETITFRGEKFEVKELSVKDMLPAMEDEGDDTMQMKMMRACVYQNGSPIGAALDDMPGGLFLALAPVVMRVNGLGQEEGND